MSRLHFGISVVVLAVMCFAQCRGENTTSTAAPTTPSTNIDPTTFNCTEYGDNQTLCCQHQPYCAFVNCTVNATVSHQGCHNLNNTDDRNIAEKECGVNSTEIEKMDVCTTDNSTTTTPVPTPTTSQKTTPAPTNATTAPPTTLAPTTPAVNTSTTAAPVTTTQAPAKTTKTPPKPAPSNDKSGQHFDAASFIGGMILMGGLIVIIYFGLKFYKARRDRNYRTL